MTLIKFMKKILIIVFLLFVAYAQTSFANDKTVFLFDNSGSMSGYYREANSAFKLFSKALIKNSVKPGDEASVLLFTKTEPSRGITSPKVLFEGAGNTINLDKVIGDFQLMRGKDGDLGRTDLIQALDDGIKALDGDRGIIWLLTDNINDVSGQGDSSFQNTLEFYERLRNDANIRKILLYPIPETITEEGRLSKGYVVYAMVYSPTELTQQEYDSYDAKLRSVGIRQKPITLKPLDIGTVVLVPQKTQSRISEGKLYFDGKTLRGFGFDEGQAYQEVFNDLTLKSNLYPYKIKSANLNVKLDEFKSSDYSVKSLGTQTITPSTVSNVSPEGEVKGFSITFNLPDITPNFSFNTIFKEDFTIGGNLILDVTNTDIALDEQYISQFNELFALQSVPQIFRPILKDKKISTEIPLEIKMKYGPWRLFILIGLIAILVLIAVGLIYLLLKKTCFELRLNNEEGSSVCVSAISSYSVSYGYSQELGKIKKPLFGGLRFQYSKFTSSPGRSAGLVEGLPIEIEYTDEEMHMQKVILTIEFTAGKREEESNGGSGEMH